MNESYYQGQATDGAIHTSANTGSSYLANSSGPANGYQSGPVSSPTNDATGPNPTTNKQGQSTGAEGNGPDFICRILDKLEKKFGGERFNNHDNDAKNLAMNQKMSARIKTIGPMVVQRLPQDNSDSNLEREDIVRVTMNSNNVNDEEVENAAGAGASREKAVRIQRSGRVRKKKRGRTA